MINILVRNIKKIIPEQFRYFIFRFLIKLKYIKYMGNNIKCPCCGCGLRDFAPYYQGSKVVDKICPRCLCCSRHRLLWLYFQDKKLFNNNLTVLHTAPEEFFEKFFKKMKNIQYISIDLSIGKAQISMDITNMTFSNNVFDVILSVHVLEHILDDKKAMKELYRILKPNGVAILQVPIDYMREKTYEDSRITSFEEREKAFQQGDHVRIYGKDYIGRLTECGFKVTIDDYVKTLDKDLIEKYCLDLNEMIYVCRK